MKFIINPFWKAGLQVDTSSGGGGGTQDFQSVTDQGSTTTNALSTGNLTINDVGGGDPPITLKYSSGDGRNVIVIQDIQEVHTNILKQAPLTGNREQDFQDASGTIELTKKPIRTIVSNDNVLTTDYTILADCSGGDVSVILPLPSSVEGQLFNIKKVANTNSVIIEAEGSSLIDGELQQVVASANFETITVQSNGLAYYIL